MKLASGLVPVVEPTVSAPYESTGSGRDLFRPPRKSKSTSGWRPDNICASAWPDPHECVHPSVPWPVLRYKFDIDLNFADASTNIGGIILNKGINLFNKANQLPQNQQKEYEAMIKLGEVELEKALPYLIKSSELDPKSRIALENLKTYYIIKKNQEKVTEISAKLENL